MCISINTSNTTKRIVPYNSYENTIFRKMKGFQVRENSPKHMIVPTRTIKYSKTMALDGPLNKIYKMHYWGECDDI
jgi:hypothetical protein